jgi:hypothetical protein
MKNFHQLAINIFLFTCLTAIQLVFTNILVFTLFSCFLLLHPQSSRKIFWQVFVSSLIFDSINFIHLGSFGLTWLITWLPFSILQLFLTRGLPNSTDYLRFFSTTLYIFFFAFSQHFLLVYIRAFNQSLDSFIILTYLVSASIISSYLTWRREPKIAL